MHHRHRQRSSIEQRAENRCRQLSSCEIETAGSLRYVGLSSRQEQETPERLDANQALESFATLTRTLLTRAPNAAETLALGARPSSAAQRKRYVSRCDEPRS